MIQKIIERVYQTLNSYAGYEGLEARRLHYMVEAILSETFKGLILIVFFTLFGALQDFIFALGALLLIRPFSGGLHFKTFSSCLAFTGGFFSLVLVLYHTLEVSPWGWWIGSLFALIIFLLAAPIQAPNRPPMTKFYMTVNKLIGVLILISHLYVAKTSQHPYLAISFWVFQCQAIQLAIGKGVFYYEKKTNRSTPTINL